MAYRRAGNAILTAILAWDALLGNAWSCRAPLEWFYEKRKVAVSAYGDWNSSTELPIKPTLIEYRPSRQRNAVEIAVHAAARERVGRKSRPWHNGRVIDHPKA